MCRPRYEPGVQRLIGFIGSLAVGVLLTAAGLILDARTLVTSGIVLLALWAVLWLWWWGAMAPRTAKQEVVQTERDTAKTANNEAFKDSQIIQIMRSAKENAAIALSHNSERSAERALPRMRAALLSGHKRFGLVNPPEIGRAIVELECGRRYIERVLPFLSGGHVEEARREAQKFVDGLN